MTDSNTVLVTGATGNLGSAVVKALIRTGFAVKAGSTDPSNATFPPEVNPVRVVFEEPDSIAEALSDVAGLFLIAPPMDPEAPSKLIPVINLAKSAGVGHIVFNSALGVDQNEEAPLRIIERYLMDSGVPHTILRPNFFMENFSTGFIGPMIASGGIFLAAARGVTSFISTTDIAEVAAMAFLKKRFGMEYNLTGQEALDHNRAAEIIAETSGKKVTYHALTEANMLQGARDSGMPEGAVQYMAILYRAVREGLMAAITDDVEKATGRKPISFSEFARNNAILWD